ncbi:NAC domain-containing protein 69 [Hirschfeldia incana]|nr:NAC domain-containing protein 69 [Hirschfeldia incana]
MEKNLVGYRFSPTGEELINHYLKNKILGKSWLVDHAISEVNICRYEPWFLPSLSKLESKDLVWYFFSPKEYTSAKKNVTKRTTPSGYWKATGVDRKIKDMRGNGVEIGIKKTLVYYEGRVPNGVWTPWVMHEYHITSLPLNQRTYVICQVMYKGDDGDSLYGNKSNEPSSSMVSDSSTFRVINQSPEVEQQGQEDGMSMNDLLIPLNQQEDLSPYDVFDQNKIFTDNNNYYPQTPYGDDYWNGLLDYNGGNFEDVFCNQELIMQENQSNHRPKRPLTGIIVDDGSSDSDAESIFATSYRGTSSPGDSDGSVDEIISSRKGSSKDIQTSINGKTRESRFTRRTIPSKQEVKEGKFKASEDASLDKKALSSIVKTEKKCWFITEKAMQRNHKNPPYIYLMNMIIGLILLVAVIGNIICFY